MAARGTGASGESSVRTRRRGRAAGRVALAGAMSAAVMASAASAAAYSYHSAASHGCHEELASIALREVRAAQPAAAPLPESGIDAGLVADLPFRPDADMRDPGAVALLIGVRDNDLKGHHALDSTDLAMIHGDPDHQLEHCLRHPAHDGTEGSRRALKACRDYVRSRVLHAIDEGLDDQGRPDPNLRTEIRVNLAYSGEMYVSLPVFYLYMGQALHALQDSFTHTFRDPKDPKKVTTVLNWVEYANGTLDERRDGPPHMTALDVCDDPDEFRQWALNAVAVAARAEKPRRKSGVVYCVHVTTRKSF